MSRIIVTGATGFIGRHLVPRLREEGHEVLCLVRDRAKAMRDAVGVDVVAVDLTVPATYEDLLPSADHLIHLAGLLASRRAVDFWKTNVQATHLLLDACLRVGAPRGRFLLMSTVAVMGPSRDGALLREADPCHPESEYGKSKLEAERIAGGFSDTLSVLILRPSFVFGPGDTRGLAALPWIIGSASSFLESLISTFSVCHVADLVEACLLSLACGLESGEVVFISDPTILTWGALRAMIRPMVGELAPWMLDQNLADGRRLTRGGGDDSLGDTGQRWACDVRKAQEALGFSPKTPLTTRVRETIQWYSNQGILGGSQPDSSSTGGMRR